MLPDARFKNLPAMPEFSTLAEERLYKKQRLAAAFRIFSQFGYDEGVAGHITLRDPEFKDTFWVNPFGVHFSQICVSNLIRVDHEGNIVEGSYPLNTAAFAIHSRLHMSRPDVNAAAHTHAPYGRAWSALGRLLDPISQDACTFYNDHALYNDYGGVAVEIEEGERITKALADKKAVILQNHGLLTVGDTVDACAWWYIALERCCHVQLLAEAAKGEGNKLSVISHEAATQAHSIVGSSYAGWFNFEGLYNKIVKEQPDLLD